MGEGPQLTNVLNRFHLAPAYGSAVKSGYATYAASAFAAVVFFSRVPKLFFFSIFCAPTARFVLRSQPRSPRPPPTSTNAVTPSSTLKRIDSFPPPGLENLP